MALDLSEIFDVLDGFMALERMSDEEYIQYLRDPKGANYVVLLEIGEGRWIGIMRLMFHWTLHTGTVKNRSGYDDRYCYQTFELASDALTEWAMRGFEGEPDRWHRHPHTGRRRPEGDASKEYVND